MSARPKKRGLLHRWRLWRLWGPRSTWNGNEVIDVTARQVRDDHWFAEGWSVCRCGKEFATWGGGPTEEQARQRALFADGLCRRCKAFIDRALDMCPDGNCTQGYRHRGRCTPFVVPPEVLEKLRAKL